MSKPSGIVKCHNIIVLTIMMIFVVSINAYGQWGRSYIREQISMSKKCRNVAITKANGDLMLYGDNGWAGASLPEGLPEALNALNKDGEYIDDVQITEEGSWLILYGNCGFQW
jgi:type II secretory pathway component PulC